MKVDKFWMIHRMGCLGEPSRRHSEYRLATDEAERLALANPGETFVVLGAVQACSVEISPVRWQSCGAKPVDAGPAGG